MKSRAQCDRCDSQLRYDHRFVQMALRVERHQSSVVCDGLIKWHAHHCTRRTIGEQSKRAVRTIRHSTFRRKHLSHPQMKCGQGRGKDETHINCEWCPCQKIESKLQSFASLISICRCCSRYAPLNVDTLFSIHFTLLCVSSCLSLFFTGSQCEANKATHDVLSAK